MKPVHRAPNRRGLARLRRSWRALALTLSAAAMAWLAGALLGNEASAQDIDRLRALSTRLAPDPLEGQWLAVDPDAETPTRSIIQIYRRNGRLFGRIVKTMDAQGHELEPVCERCVGDLRGKRYTEIEFIRDLKPSGSGWVGGAVVDLRPGPLQGALASCDLTLQGERAVLHGYMGLRWLGKSSIWVRHIGP
ncbi:DUF2147 domain-containing protein [Leptothrix discophora]|uniref:DUF2147 domain-containing protein n=1 Tax=Leptothrix discophora TaxID=89 RepID=A0ABT9G2P2_LEPDI|nr:DUF2147 domain-containing protein [Leptothrix discophora]MDP4300754.1 DUF2147 domain-containing protein [Leptothrix discophora]